MRHLNEYEQLNEGIDPKKVYFAKYKMNVKDIVDQLYDFCDHTKVKKADILKKLNDKSCQAFVQEYFDVDIEGDTESTGHADVGVKYCKKLGITLSEDYA